MTPLIRRNMGALIVFLGIAASSILPSGSALAYDLDTHFYHIYMIARHAGLSHEVAVYLGVGSQWVDESMTTTPMFSSRQRHIWHFPSYKTRTNRGLREGGIVAAVSPQETRMNHPLASSLFMEGLEQGDFLKIAASLHTIADSFAHAGFEKFGGHGYAGHGPDRPWLDSTLYDRYRVAIPNEKVNDPTIEKFVKFELMVRTMFQAMVAIRDRLPEEALDLTLRTATGTRNAEADSLALYEDFIRQSGVDQFYRHDYFADPRFVKTATEEVLRRALKRGIIQPSVSLESILPPDSAYDGMRETHEVLREVFMKLEERQAAGEKVLNLELLRSKIIPGHLPAGLDAEELFRSPERREARAGEIVDQITASVVPRRQSDDHHTTLEEEGLVRRTEMQIRISDLRQWIHQKYGQNIVFESRLWREMIVEKIHEIVAQLKSLFTGQKMNRIENPFDLQATRITMPWRVRWQFIKKMVSYFFTFLPRNSSTPRQDALAYQRPYRDTLWEPLLEKYPMLANSRGMFAFIYDPQTFYDVFVSDVRTSFMRPSKAEENAKSCKGAF